MAIDDPRLADYLDEWLARRRTQLRPTTLRGYRQTINCYVRPWLGGSRLSELDRRGLERHYAMLLDRGGRAGRPLSPRTVQLTHAVLHRALKDALLDGLLERNPAELARTPRRDPYATEADESLHVWTAAQARRFLDLVADHPWRVLWHLALGTGARRGELLGLRWQDVDLDAARLTIRRSLSVVDGVPRLLATKTNRVRAVALGCSLVTELERASALDRPPGRWDLVVAHPDGAHEDPLDVSGEFRRLVRELDVPVIRVHDLRHTHASLLLEQGVPAKVVSERLGHTTIAMTMDIYAHLLPSMDREAAAQLDRILMR